jgi:uncharacterized protein
MKGQTMTLHITTIYAIILALMMTGLSMAVTMKRAKTGISILHGDNMDLATSMRRFGNFIESVPLGLLLLLLMEVQTATQLWLHASGALLVIGRMAHAAGLDAQNAKSPLRIMGGMLTMVSRMIAVVFLFSHQFI